MLNRAGESIFWSSNSENLINYLKCFSEGYFVQKVVPLLLLSNTPIFVYYMQNYNKIKYSDEYLEKTKKIICATMKAKSRKLLLLKARRFAAFKSLKFFMSVFNKKYSFTTKVFFVSYSDWIVVTVRLLNFKKISVILKKKNKRIILYWKYAVYLRLLRESKIFNYKKQF